MDGIRIWAVGEKEDAHRMHPPLYGWRTGPPTSGTQQVGFVTGHTWPGPDNPYGIMKAALAGATPFIPSAAVTFFPWGATTGGGGGLTQSWARLIRFQRQPARSNTESVSTKSDATRASPLC